MEDDVKMYFYTKTRERREGGYQEKDKGRGIKSLNVYVADSASFRHEKKMLVRGRDVNILPQTDLIILQTIMMVGVKPLGKA